MRIVALLMVMSGVALADLGPPNGPTCDGYDACRYCMTSPDGGQPMGFDGPLDAGWAAPDCAVHAILDGYIEKSCSQSKWSGTLTYYCRPDEQQPTQGCSSVMLGAPLALLAVFGAWRTRKRA